MGIYDCDKEFCLTDEVIKSFDKNGFLVLKNFLSQSEILPLQRQIFDLSMAIGQVSPADSSLQLNADNDAYHRVDQHLLTLLNTGKVKQSLLYDRLQQMPSLLAMPSHPKIQKLASEILRAKYLGVWPRVQVRMDVYGDQWNVINWHHDYMYNEGTSASITFWIPLVQITKKMGPIKIARGTHLKNYNFIETKDAKFKMTLDPKDIASLELIDHDEFNPGDVCIMHSKTIHTGCLNEDADRARLTCLFRMQDLSKLEH